MEPQYLCLNPFSDLILMMWWYAVSKDYSQPYLKVSMQAANNLAIAFLNQGELNKVRSCPPEDRWNKLAARVLPPGECNSNISVHSPGIRAHHF